MNRDVGGVWTIGYGTTYYPNGTVVKEGDVITQQQADEIFAYQIDTGYAPNVDQLVTPEVSINQDQFDSLVSFTYNIGVVAFGDSTLLKKVKVDPNDPTIRDEFMRWVYVNGVVIQGLVNRRQAEADYYFSVVIDLTVC